MKVLVDTCAWSLLLRRRNKTTLKDDEKIMVASVEEAIRDGQVVIIGPIRQEVLSGIKDTAQFEKLRAALRSFQDEQITTLHYEDAAHIFNTCMGHGVQCGAVDILICAVAARLHCTILTSDRGIMRCIEVLRSERLM